MTENGEKAIETLKKLGIEFEMAVHAPAFTMEGCAEAEEKLGAPMCKNLFLTNRQMTDFYLLLIPGDKPFKTKYLSAQLGVSRLSFGSGEQMESLLGCAPGSASVMGALFDTAHRVRILLDAEVAAGEYILCHPCENDASLKIKTADILTKFLPHTGHDYTVVTLPREVE